MREGQNDQPNDDISVDTEQAAGPCTGEVSVGDYSEVQDEIVAATIQAIELVQP